MKSENGRRRVQRSTQFRPRFRSGVGPLQPAFTKVNFSQTGVIFIQNLNSCQIISFLEIKAQFISRNDFEANFFFHLSPKIWRESIIENLVCVIITEDSYQNMSQISFNDIVETFRGTVSTWPFRGTRVPGKKSV